jgi:GH15 family glucan-1,4-alpha-glucosidase
MPRDLPAGNGSLLVNFDASYTLRDLYFPHVGKENQSNGHPFRFGIWVDGVFRWIDDAGWQRELKYEHDTLVTSVSLHHPDLPVSLVCNDFVDFHENAYVRRLRVTSESDRPVEVRFFFHHDFHIYGNDVGDTAYYEPQRKVVFHYKDLRWFLINGYRSPSDYGVDQFACGQKEVNGLEGTWKDAEDGLLSGNPVAQGSVDSTIGLHLKLEPRGYGELFYWIAAGERFDDVTGINRRIVAKGPAALMNRNDHYWRLWLRGAQNELSELPDKVARLFTRSLLIVRTQIDVDGGILAANDFDVTRFNRDTYSYIWPRDGALVANALIEAGFSGPSRHFFEFFGRLLTKEGYYLHKYNPDGSLASSWHPWYADHDRELPIQEDETGLILWALWRYFTRFPEVEFIKPLYRDVIVKAADFLVDFRDPKTGLPQPSWDLWEERRGVHGWTIAAVYAGLQAAAEFADAFGEHDLRDTYRSAATELREATDRFLWQEAAGRFARRLIPAKDGSYTVDWTIDSSVVGLFLFGMYDPRDPKIVRTMESVRERLWVKTTVGGIARYENDYYHQVASDVDRVPGNPWFVCSLWVARWIIAMADCLDDLKPAEDLLCWAAEHALPSGVLAEQVHPLTGEPLSVSPLTWSHGEVVSTVVEYLDRVSHLNRCPTCDQPLFLRERLRVRALREVLQHTHPATP